MTEIPQSTIEAAVRMWIEGPGDLVHERMRGAIQAALDDGDLVLASERATPKSELRRQAAVNAECPICFERVFVAPQDEVLREAAQAVLDPDSSKDGSGLTWASRAAMERLRRELAGTE